MNILLSFYISHMNWKPSGRRYGCNNLIKFACVCVCVCTVNTQGIFKAKNAVLRSTAKSACRLPVYKIPLKYSVAPINTKRGDVGLK